jgi:glycosyltransferase involved in cell wall biosynthesis
MAPPTSGPKVSVLVPTYNYARYLSEAIESVLAQDFADFELLISDDASTDGSAEIIREFARRDPRIRVQFHSRNLGMVANWNWCLGQARGQYIKFLFGDDRLMGPDSLGRLVALLDNAPTAVLAASARVILDPDSQPTTTWNDWRHPGVHGGLSVIARCMWEDRNLIGEPSAVLFRRGVTDRGFDPSLRQVVDQEMWFHLLLHGDFAYTPDPLCAFRQHEAQQTMVNRCVHIGPRESLVILARYLVHVAHPVPGGFSWLAQRRTLYRRLHYSRKNVPRSPEILAAEAAIRAQLPQPWYALMWSWHRATKPWFNLRRWIRRQLQRLPSTATPPLALQPTVAANPARSRA